LLAVGTQNIRLLPEAETNLYRITQEALNNIHKHAEARNVEVILTERDEEVVLIISDDGKGFVVEDRLKENKGIGLVGMQERAELVGGNLEIESEPGAGTTIYVHLPLTVKKSRDR
jgi:two-component system, NarL family, sensor histidine kinase NreB